MIREHEGREMSGLGVCSVRKLMNSIKNHNRSTSDRRKTNSSKILYKAGWPHRNLIRNHITSCNRAYSAYFAYNRVLRNI